VWNPGIPGGIPAVTTVYTTINAATYGNGTTDATAAINNAIQAAGNAAASTGIPQVVFLPAGTYRVSQPIVLDQSHVVLRGAGAGFTKIRQYSDCAVIWFGSVNYDWSGTSVVAVSGNVAKGSTSVTVANASGFSVGDIIQIDQIDDTSYISHGTYYWTYDKRSNTPDTNGPPSSHAGYRSIGQQLEIVSKSGNTLGIRGVIHMNYNSTFYPEAFKMPSVFSSGLEDFTVSGGGNPSGNGQIAGDSLAYSWVKGVEGDGRPASGGMVGIHIQLAHAYRCEIRQCYTHHATNIIAGGNAYGITLRGQSSDNLVEDNISMHLNKPMVNYCTGGGNVIAYNYVDNAYSTDFPGWEESGVDGNHGSYSVMDLFEGNWGSNIGADSTHYDSGWLTFFRNYAQGKNSSPPAPDNGNVRAVGIDGMNRNFNVVGNVLNTAGVVNGAQPIYQSVDPTTLDPAAIFRIGANSMGGSYEVFDDGTALKTLYRHGNYDYVTNSVIWDPTNADHTLPASLYLTAKPAFFGSLTWPWVDPLGATKVYTLPAKARFDAGTPIPLVQVTSISPVSGSTAGGTTVTVRGGGFQPGSTVTLGGVAVSSVVVSGLTTLTAVTGAHETALVDVTVTIPGSWSATLSQAFFYSPPSAPARFFTLAPCRLVDTRAGQPPALTATERRVWTVTGACGVPPTATALALNVTVTQATAAGWVRLTPGNGLADTSTLNFSAGQTRANNAVVWLATDGTGSLAATNGSLGSVHVILDVSGYFQ